MAKIKAKKPIEDRDAAEAQYAASLPDDEPSMMKVAKAAVEAAHAAILRGDWAGVRPAFLPYNAVVWKLNGGTFFGCMAEKDSAGKRVERYCAAPPGAVPMWGQTGEFLIDVEGVRCWVVVGRGFGHELSASLNLNAVDLESAFISPTGYKSHFANPEEGKTVADKAEEAVRYYLHEPRERRYVTQGDAERLARKPLPAWLSDMEPAPRRYPATDFSLAPDTIPEGFELVDVVVKSHQAFQIRKWADAAKPRIRAAMAAQRDHSACIEDADDEAARDATTAEDTPEQTQPWPFTPASQIWKARNAAAEPAEPADSIEAGKCYEVESEKKQIIVTKVNPDFGSVWAHDNKPVKYRMNQRGRKVEASNPQCVETLYSIADLRPVD